MLPQPVKVVFGAGNRRVEVEVVVGHTGDGHLALDAAQFGEHVDKTDATVPGGKAVGR